MDRGRRHDEGSDDSPMYSRLFIVYDKKLNEDNLRNAFSKFGTIEDIRLPRDHNTGELKGIAFIKFSATSEAAAAVEEMHLNVVPGSTRPLKVMIAGNRSDIQADEDEEKYRRLFIHVPKISTENELDQYFSQFGKVDAIVIQRDHNTGDSKGFAYIKFKKFIDAAKAIENCDKSYRAIFAKPKGQKRHETAYEANIDSLASSSASILSLINTRPGGYTRVNYLCSPHLNHYYVESLFSIVPGMLVCTFFVDLARNCGKGTVTYTNPISAAYAVEKFDNFEYPPGAKIYVKPDNSKFDSREHKFEKIPTAVNNLKNAIAATTSGTTDLAKLAQAIAEASKYIKMVTSGIGEDSVPSGNDLSYCSAELPPTQPLADMDSPVAKRCFLVCKPQPPPLTVLRDVFCRFGNLINVYTLPNKIVGYARYATEESANAAIKALHGAEICGVRMKVIEAEEEAPNKRKRYD